MINGILRKCKNRVFNFFLRKNFLENKNLSVYDIGYFVIGDISKLKIGERVSFGGNVLLYLNEEIEIGNDTMIAINAVLHTSTHDYNLHPMRRQRIDMPIKVGSHVWIGLNALILPGSIIEDFAVIGAGSVVSGIVPRGAIVAGNPAKIIKYRDFAVFENGDEFDERSEILSKGYTQKIIKQRT
jgi:acetyltransferase-like isoleucine patch superfamily enzyme